MCLTRCASPESHFLAAHGIVERGILDVNHAPESAFPQVAPVVRYLSQSKCVSWRHFAKAFLPYIQLGVAVALFKTDVERSPTAVTESVPEETWFWAAIVSIGLSLMMKLLGRDNLSLFIGQWPATFLLLGLYRRLSK